MPLQRWSFLKRPPTLRMFDAARKGNAEITLSRNRRGRGGPNLTNPQGTTVPLPTPSNQKENNITIQQQEMHF